MTPPMTQLTLIPGEGLSPVTALMDVPLDRFPETFPGKGPAPALITSIRRYGVLQPIVASGTLTDPTILDGRRRILASREAGRVHIPCHLIRPDEASSALPLTVALNRLRSDNPVSELLIVERLVRDGHSIDDVADACGVTRGAVNRLLQLGALIPQLRKALLDGQMALGPAYEAARLPKALQGQLVLVLVGTGRVTGKHVHAAKEARRDRAATSISLPGLDATQDDTWRSRAHAHLVSFLALLPNDYVIETYVLDNLNMMARSLQCEHATHGEKS